MTDKDKRRALPRKQRAPARAVPETRPYSAVLARALLDEAATHNEPPTKNLAELCDHFARRVLVIGKLQACNVPHSIFLNKNGEPVSNKSVLDEIREQLVPLLAKYLAREAPQIFREGMKPSEIMRATKDAIAKSHAARSQDDSDGQVKTGIQARMQDGILNSERSMP